MSLPGPLSPVGVPADVGPRERFDAVVAGVLRAMDRHLSAEPDQIEVLVEDVPIIPPEWDDPIPFSSLTKRGPVSRIAIYRLPVVARAGDDLELQDLVWQIVLDRLAEVWRLSPDDIDPR